MCLLSHVPVGLCPLHKGQGVVAEAMEPSARGKEYGGCTFYKEDWASWVDHGVDGKVTETEGADNCPGKR